MYILIDQSKDKNSKEYFTLYNTSEEISNIIGENKQMILLGTSLKGFYTKDKYFIINIKTISKSLPEYIETIKSIIWNIIAE